jgi:hypothetical protein
VGSTERKAAVTDWIAIIMLPPLLLFSVVRVQPMPDSRWVRQSYDRNAARLDENGVFKRIVVAYWGFCCVTWLKMSWMLEMMRNEPPSSVVFVLYCFVFREEHSHAA